MSPRNLINYKLSLRFLILLILFFKSNAENISSLIEGTYDDVHIVFTTGCSGYQNWQSETLLYSWARIQQPGRITRIIAGCKTDDERLKANTTAIPNIENRINFYFVPDYTPSQTDINGKPLPRRGRPFHYFNKPFGMLDWLTNSSQSIYENVIILLDPDMIIIKPFLFHIKDEAEKYAEYQHKYTSDGRETKDGPRDMHVRKGNPVSQKYGIGGKWIKWNGFCDERESCKISGSTAWKYYSIGPPYIMHKMDWMRITPLWVKYSPLALKYEPMPSILAEMYSFSIACAYYDLKHEYLFSMLSDPGSSVYMENWSNLNWNEIYEQSEQSLDENHIHIIHYCQGFWLGKNRNEGTIRLGGWNWHKGHVPQEILYDCKIPLLVELKGDSNAEEDSMQIFKIRDHSKEKRHTWILYHIYKYVNEAVLNYRLKYCSDEEIKYELVLQQPESDRKTHRRMNYILNDYDSKISYRGH